MEAFWKIWPFVKKKPVEVKATLVGTGSGSELRRKARIELMKKYNQHNLDYILKKISFEKERGKTQARFSYYQEELDVSVLESLVEKGYQYTIETSVNFNEYTFTWV